MTSVFAEIDRLTLYRGGICEPGKSGFPQPRFFLLEALGYACLADPGQVLGAVSSMFLDLQQRQWSASFSKW